MNQQAEEIFQTAQEMMDSIRAVKGEKFSRTVEIALNMMKMRSLCGTLLNDLEDEIGVDRCSSLFGAVNKCCAHVISLAAANGDIIRTANPGEIIDWAEKIMKLEERGVEAMGDEE